MVLNGFLTVAFTVLTVAVPVVVGAQREGFQGRLSPLPVDARTAATITGEGMVSAELNGTELTIQGSFEGMSSAASRAHMHRAQPGHARAGGVCDRRAHRRGGRVRGHGDTRRLRAPRTA